MTGSMSPNLHSSPKGGGGRRDWVQPRQLLILAGVLVVTTMAVVAVREFRGRPGEVRRPAERAEGRVEAPARGPTDRTAADEFHSAFAARLPERLRGIGFGPGPVGHEADRADQPDRWHITVPQKFPVLRVNANITELAHSLDGDVYWAEQDPQDLAIVRMEVGAGNLTTDRIVLRRTARRAFKGTIAIIIDDVGNRPVARTRDFIRLPYALTFAVLPGHVQSEQIAREAREAGKDVIVHLPMEPLERRPDLEPHTVMTSMDDEAIRDLTAHDLDAVPGALGANNHMGSKATEDPRVMRAVLEVLRSRDMFFIDSRTSGKSVAESTAHDLGVLTARRSIFLDNESSALSIGGQVREAARIAEREGAVIAVGHDRGETYRVLAEMLPELEGEGYRICSARELVR